MSSIYIVPMKFHVDALHSFEVMLRTKQGRTDGLTEGRTDGRNDGKTDGQTSRSLYATLRGHKNNALKPLLMQCLITGIEMS